MVNQTNLEPQSYYKVVWKVVHNNPWYGKTEMLYKETYLNKEAAVAKCNSFTDKVDEFHLYLVEETESIFTESKKGVSNGKPKISR